MTVSRINTIFFACLCLISSCDLFNGNSSGEGGEIIWSVDHQTPQNIMVQPLIDNGNVYVYQDGFLKSFDLPSGNLRWSDQVFNDATDGSFRNKLSDSENIYLDRGFFYRSYNKETGQLNWNRDFTNNGNEFSGLGGARISQDEDFLYLPRRRRVLKVKKADGEIIYEFLLDRLIAEGIEQGATNPIPSPHGDDLLYVPTAYWDTVNTPNRLRGNIFAFNKNSGDLVWEFKAPSKVMPTEEFEATDSLTVASPIFDIAIFEELLVAAAGPTVILLNRNNGDLIWQIPIKDRRFTGPGEENSFGGVDVGLTVDDTGIYIVTLDGTARKLDWNNGSELWSVNITYSNTSIPTVKNDILYFNNSGGGGIWVIDTLTGKVLFNSPPPGHSENSNDSYISSLGVGGGYMVNVGALRVYTLRSFE